MKHFFRFSRIALIGFLLCTLLFTKNALALLPGNANGDSVVDGLDYVIWLNNYGSSKQGPSFGNFNGDSVVDGLDYVIWLNNYGSIEPTTNPTSTPPTGNSGEWSQFASTAQKTSYATTIPATPWRFKWQWNGADANGKTQAGHLSVPDQVQPITGGNRVYVIAANTVYALDKTTGNVLWSRGSIGTLNATGVYTSELLYVPSSDGHVYKLNAATGATLSSFTGAGSFTTALLFANNTLYAGSSNGTLYAINPTTMVQVWTYAAGSPIVTPASYSPSRGIALVVSQDLYVHAINVSSGVLKWRVKPTTRTYTTADAEKDYTEALNGWPVVAEQHGIVFVRYRLEWNSLWIANPFPTTNDTIRTLLTSNSRNQALFAMKLDDGSQAFIPNAGNGGAGDGGRLPMGPQPVIRVVDGKEVAYIIWRNGLTCGGCSTAGSCGNQWCDGREDAAMGEMVLDNTTVSGYQAGDVRFIRNPDIQTDEMMYIAAAGDTIFHSHWLINSAEKITDRSAGLGNTFSNPIKTTDSPFVIWRQCNITNTCNYPGCTSNTVCENSCAPSSSRYCSKGLYSYGDKRSYPPGFYEYNNDMNGGSTPFTVVSAGQILVKTDDGAIIALESGSPTGSTQKTSDLAQTTTTTDGLGATFPNTLNYSEARKHIGEYAVFSGTINSVVNHLPKALYLGFTDPHDGSLLVRIFAKDLTKFTYDPRTLKGKKIEVKGLVTSYWPDNVDPEIVVTEPNQIVILN